jgi:hypothetical protein
LFAGVEPRIARKLDVHASRTQQFSRVSFVHAPDANKDADAFAFDLSGIGYDTEAALWPHVSVIRVLGGAFQPDPALTRALWTRAQRDLLKHSACYHVELDGIL